MLDKPNDYNDLTEWFRYFRMTKYLPAMPNKLKDAMRAVPDVASARHVMTAYAAAAIDIALYIPMGGPAELARDLEFLTGLRPVMLQSLSVHEIAQPMKITAEDLAVKLKTTGFQLDSNGMITGFEAPRAATAAGPTPAAAPPQNRPRPGL